LPFRPLNRRSGRIPAEANPPFKFLQCRTNHAYPVDTQDYYR
jgi:hypothetical protein